MKNLWRNLENLKGDTNNPIDLVKEQSVFLQEGTEDMFYINIDEINRIPLALSKVLSSTNIESDFSYKMDLCSDGLLDYAFNIFNIYYGITFYPLLVSVPNEIGLEIIEMEIFNCVNNSSATITYFVINSEEEFEQILEYIFNSDKVRTVLRNMKSIIGNDVLEE